MDRFQDYQVSPTNDNYSSSTGRNSNPGPHTDPEIEEPNPSIATPSYPEEVPAREFS